MSPHPHDKRKSARKANKGMTLAAWIIFSFLLMAGAGMRFHVLERQSLWDDEMSTITDIQLPLTQWPQRFATYEMHPPLYFLQLKVWRFFSGDSLAGLRANSAIWGSLSLILIFLLAKRLWGFEIGLAALAVMATSPYHLAYSQELRPYAFAGFLALFAFLQLERCLEKKATPERWFALTGILIALLYAHYWGSFAAVAMGVYGWKRGQQSTHRTLLIVGGVAIAAFVLWFPMLYRQLHYVGELSFWVPIASTANLARSLMAYTGLYFNHASVTFQSPGPEVWLELVGLAMVIIAGMGLWNRPRVAAIWLGVGLGFPFVLSYWVHGLYVWYRYPALMFPAFVLALASGLRALPERWVTRWLIFSILIFQSAWGCGYYLATWQKANPKEVMAYVQSLKAPNAVVIRPFYFAPLFNYYDQNPVPVFEQDKLDDAKKRAEALKGKKIIFVAFDAPSDAVASALLSEFKIVSARYFPGHAHLGITVYELK
jgi:uncharacterized membrane protein